MKEIQTFFAQVDLYRCNGLLRSYDTQLSQRSTAGTYLVGAKTPKEAKDILQNKIKFGSITIPKYQFGGKLPKDYPVLKYKEVCKIEAREQEGKLKRYFNYDIKSAIDFAKKYIEDVEENKETKEKTTDKVSANKIIDKVNNSFCYRNNNHIEEDVDEGKYFYSNNTIIPKTTLTILFDYKNLNTHISLTTIDENGEEINKQIDCDTVENNDEIAKALYELNPDIFTLETQEEMDYDRE